MKIVKAALFLVLAAGLSGCLLTRIVSMPMRVGGAVATIVPVLGDVAHDSVDKAAELVDEIPI